MSNYYLGWVAIITGRLLQYCVVSMIALTYLESKIGLLTFFILMFPICILIEVGGHHICAMIILAKEDK